MKYVTSRKHPVAVRSAFGRSATLATSLALALPAVAGTAHAAAADAAPDAAAADISAESENLPTVKVQGHEGPGYKVDETSGPKFVKPLVDTTQSIQIISSELIQDQVATTLTEALRNSPGVGTFYVGENGSTSTGDSIYMRGFDSSSSIFVDGVRDLGSISRDVFNVSQIEVIKGPSGSDYGRTSPTGSVNLVSKQAMLDNALSGTVSYGSSNQKRITADWNQTLEKWDGAAFRLNVMGQDSGVPGRDEVENNRWGIAPAFAFGLGSSTRVFVDLLHIKQSNVPDGGVPTMGLPGYTSPDPERPELASAPRVDSSNFYGTTSDHDDSKTDMFTVIVQHDFNDDVKLTNTSRWGRTHQDYLLTSFMGSATRWITPDLSDPSTWSILRALPTFKDQTNRIATNQTNLRIHSDFGGGMSNDISTGLEIIQEKSTNIGMGALDGSAWPAANLYNPDPNVTGLIWGRTGAEAHGKTDTQAAYLFDTLTFNEQWQLNAGIRFDHYKTDFNSLVACGGRGAPACGDLPTGTIVPGVDDSKSDTLFNWKVGLLYKPASNGSIYADYAISQQPPGGSSLTLSASANSLDNPIFDPQKAKTAEIGTKWELLDSRLLLTASLYRTEVTNEVVQDPVDQLYYQIGKKRVQGIELGLVGQITENWSVSAGFTTMDAKVEKGSNVSQDGSDDLAYTPDSAFTMWTTYQTPFKLTIGGGARYSGELKRGTDGAVGTPDHTDSYWVFDAMAKYPINDHFDVQLNIYNLFDKDYVAAINKSGYRYTPGAPRSALLTANFRF